MQLLWEYAVCRVQNGAFSSDSFRYKIVPLQQWFPNILAVPKDKSDVSPGPKICEVAYKLNATQNFFQFVKFSCLIIFLFFYFYFQTIFYYNRKNIWENEKGFLLVTHNIPIDMPTNVWEKYLSLEYSPVSSECSEWCQTCPL